jgi:hypothetical protein
MIIIHLNYQNLSNIKSFKTLIFQINKWIFFVLSMLLYVYQIVYQKPKKKHLFDLRFIYV